MIEIHEIKLEDSFYSTADEKAEFLSEVLQETITSVLEYIAIKDKQALNSFIHFCNTGKFLDELDS